MLQCTSWQKIHSCAYHQLLIADRPTHRLPLAVLLPMRPGLIGRGVVHQLVQIGWYLHPIDPDAWPRSVELVGPVGDSHALKSRPLQRCIYPDARDFPASMTDCKVLTWSSSIGHRAIFYRCGSQKTLRRTHSVAFSRQRRTALIAQNGVP